LFGSLAIFFSNLTVLLWHYVPRIGIIVVRLATAYCELYTFVV